MNDNPHSIVADAAGAEVVAQINPTSSPSNFQPLRPIDWALQYAAIGWYVLPLHSMRDGRCSRGNPDCPSPAKHPRTKRGEKDASKDPAQIRKWWGEYPDANIGIATGPSGLVVLDVDGPDGLKQLREVAQDGVPRTLAARTGREGGFHLFYKGTGIGSSQVRGEHLDVRGTTGYVVAAGSIHANGTEYVWVNPDVLPAPVPAWVGHWVAHRSGAKTSAACGLNLGPKPAYLAASGRPIRVPVLSAPPAYSESEAARVRSALAAIPADVDGKTWVSIGAALHDLKWIVDGTDIAFHIWDAWSATSTGKGPGNGEYRGRADLEKRWSRFDRDYNGRRTTIATIYFLALERGWNEDAVAGTRSADRESEQADDASGDSHRSQTPQRNLMMTAADLRMKRFEPVRYVLPEFVPEGLTLLVGRPKIGKSWWVLDLCLACATARTTLGALKPVDGDVLYLALEDGWRRLHRRLQKLIGTIREEWPERLTLVAMGGWPRAHEGGLAQIEDWCKSVAKPVLIVVDTLERFRKPANGKAPLYSADYEAVAGLQKIASDHGIAIIVLHHDRKSDADDAFDTVSGTLGLPAAADTILIIKRRASGIVLYARGRDIEESETALQFDKDSCRWIVLGKAAEVQRSNERAQVVAVLKAAGQPLSIKDIMLETGMHNRNAVDLLLSKMARDREIERAQRGLYRLPADAGGQIGQIGQKERLEGQATDLTRKMANLSDLSDLSEQPA